MATRGYGAAVVEECYRRARTLCGELGNPPKLAPVMYGLWSYHIVRAQHFTALELGQQILAIGEATGDSGLQVQGDLAIGWSQLFLGRLVPAREHLERALQMYDPDTQPPHAYMVDDPATSAGSCLAFVEWFLGYQDRARQTSSAVLERLQTASNPYNVAFGLMVSGFLSIALGEYSMTRELAERTIALSDQHSLPLTGSMGRILHGYALVCLGEIQTGITEMRDALSGYAATGAELAMPYWHWLLADAAERGGLHDEALVHLANSEAVLKKTAEAYFEAEVHRLRGDILWQLADPRKTAAHQALQRAIGVAAETESRSLELRARLALARIYVAERRADDARRLLKDAYAWFTEGFDSEDLRAARALLEQLDAVAIPPGAVSRSA
jgi:predicted ATPase